MIYHIYVCYKYYDSTFSHKKCGGKILILILTSLNKYWYLLLGHILPYPCFISIIYDHRHIYEYTFLHIYMNESVVKLSS